jgi:uncharacterized protein (DUF1330 family)
MLNARAERRAYYFQMKAYIIVDVNVTDPVLYESYKKLTPASLEPFEGKFVVRGGTCETLEGDWKQGRIVVLEFPTRQKAKDWWSSAGYAPAKAIRQAASHTRMILIDGIDS